MAGVSAVPLQHGLPVPSGTIILECINARCKLEASESRESVCTILRDGEEHLRGQPVDSYVGDYALGEVPRQVDLVFTDVKPTHASRLSPNRYASS